MASPAVTPAGQLNSQTANSSAMKRRFIAHITRDQGPEYEQTLAFTNTTALTTPRTVRTDRKSAWIQFHVKGRIPVGAAPVTFRTGPPLLGANSGAALFSLIQQFDI